MIETEKLSSEQLLQSGTLSSSDLLEKSKKIGLIIQKLEAKELRWLELQEKNN